MANSNTIADQTADPLFDNIFDELQDDSISSNNEPKQQIAPPAKSNQIAPKSTLKRSLSIKDTGLLDEEFINKILGNDDQKEYNEGNLVCEIPALQL